MIDARSSCFRLDKVGWDLITKAMHRDHNQHYHHLLIMIVLSFIAMFVLMYAMVNIFSNV